MLRERLGSDEILRGVLNVIPSAFATQALASAGADFVVIDCEHGPIGPETMHAMIAATAGTGCAPLVRVPGLDEAAVKGALDAGAEGVVYPLVRTAADAERCVSLMTYPPAGVRGWGPFAAHSRHGTTLGDYASEIGARLTCCVLLETVEALENIDAIVAVEGIDLFIVAQFDLSTALGVPGQFDAPEFRDAVATLETAVARAGKPLGAAALSAEQSRALVDRGYRVLLCAFDVVALEDAVRAFKAWA